jgi:hypothetical protein
MRVEVLCFGGDARGMIACRSHHYQGTEMNSSRYTGVVEDFEQS